MEDREPLDNSSGSLGNDVAPLEDREPLDNCSGSSGNEVAPFEDILKTTIKNIINKALPTLNSSVVDVVANLLILIGVENVYDVQHVVELDLKDTGLKPLQIRKLIQYSKTFDKSNETDVVSSAVSSAVPSVVPTENRSLLDEPSTSNQAGTSGSKNNQESAANLILKISNENWADKYNLRIEIFTKPLQRNLMKNIDLSLKERSLIVRQLVDDSLKKCIRPSRGDMRKIASHFTKRFPNAIIDKVRGKTIGSGISCLVQQLYNRLEHLSRVTENAMPRVKDVRKTKKPRLELENSEHYKFNPETSEEDLNKCESIRKELLELHLNMNPPLEEVEEKMKLSYHLQRSDINKGMDMNEIKIRCPFLFTSTGMKAHLQELLGQNVLKFFVDFFKEKCPLFLNFFGQSKKKFCIDIIENLKKGEHTNAKLIGSVLLMIMNHFKEDPQKIFPTFEPGTATSEILKKTEKYSTLIVIGNLLLKYIRN